MMDLLMAFSKKLNVCSQSEGFSDMLVKQRGFTLIELIITVVIAAIVMTIAVPGFQSVIRNNRVAAHTNDFLSALNLARTEAIKRGRQIVLCKRNAAGSDCVTTGGWEQGWIAFVDNNNDATVDVGEEILRVYESISGENTITAGSVFEHYIAYTQMGYPNPPAAVTDPWTDPAKATITFNLCDSQNRRRTIWINRIGRPSLNTPSC